jgi:hypothetical protein
LPQKRQLNRPYTHSGTSWRVALERAIGGGRRD